MNYMNYVNSYSTNQTSEGSVRVDIWAGLKSSSSPYQLQFGEDDIRNVKKCAANICGICSGNLRISMIASVLLSYRETGECTYSPKITVFPPYSLAASYAGVNLFKLSSPASLRLNTFKCYK